MLRSQASGDGGSSGGGGGGRNIFRGSRTSSSERSSNKKQRSNSGKTRWPFGRKSSKSISQQGTTSGDDDFLPVFSPSREGEFAMPQAATGDGSHESSPTAGEEGLGSRSSTTSVESESPLTRSSDSGSNLRAQVGEAAAVSVAAAAASSVNEQELTHSTQTEGDQQQSAETRTEEATSEERPQVSIIIDSQQEDESQANTAETEQQQIPQESGGGGVEGEGVEAIPNASPAIGELGRQSTIVRASGLQSNDRDAAVRARQRARIRGQHPDGRHRRNTDELTNEGNTVCQ